MNQLQKTFKYLKQKNDRADRYDIIPAVKSWSADRRVSELLRLGLVEKRILGEGTLYHEIKTEYKITELGLQMNVLDVRVPKKPKTKKTREESEIKKICKEYTPPIEPTTICGQIRHFLYKLFK